MRAWDGGIPWRGPERGAGLPASSSPAVILAGWVCSSQRRRPQIAGVVSGWTRRRRGRKDAAERRVGGSAEAPRMRVRPGAGTRTAVPLRPQTRMAAAAPRLPA